MARRGAVFGTEEPVRQLHEKDVPGAVREVREAHRAGERIGAVPAGAFARQQCTRHPRDPFERADEGVANVFVAGDRLPCRGGQVDLAAHRARDRLGAAQGRTEGLFNPPADRLGGDAPGRQPLRRHLFGNRRHPVIAGQGDDVARAADLAVERREERSERRVEPQQHVLHFVALRSEVVADQIERRETDAQVVRAGARPEVQRLDRRLAETFEVRVGKRALFPRLVALARLHPVTLERMRERGRPEGWRALAASGIVIQVERGRLFRRPRGAQVGGDRVRAGEALDERHRGRGVRGGRDEAACRCVVPGDRRRAMSREHDRGPLLHRESDDAGRDGRLGAELVGEGRRRQPRGALASAHGIPVTDRRLRRVVRAVDGLAARAVPPRIAGDAVRARERTGGDGRVARAGDGVGVGVERLLEPGARVDQAAQAARPLVPVLQHVVGAHLVDDEHDDERRLCGSRDADRRGRIERQCHERAEHERQDQHVAGRGSNPRRTTCRVRGLPGVRSMHGRKDSRLAGLSGRFG